jgi:3-hydroxyacyl-CoA dehydrogenase
MNPSIFLIGAGVVGREVAAAHLRAGLAIDLVEASPDRLQASVDWLSEFGLVDGEPTRWGDNLRVRIGPVQNALCQASTERTDQPPLVIESIIENPLAKRKLLLSVGQLLGTDCILGTNTSTLRLQEIITPEMLPERVVGLHFFMPVQERSLIEVVRGDRTSTQTIQRAIAHVHRLGRQELIVRDSPGFVVNRLLSPYLNQSLHALCRGASPEHVERVARSLGMPMGPLELLDWIGLETSLHAGRALWKAFPQRIEPTPLLPAMIKSKQLGRFCGQGFYRYDKNRCLHPVALQKIRDFARDELIWTDPLLRDWLFLPMLNEAAGLLHEEVVSSLEEINRGLRLGLGFRQESLCDIWPEESGTAILDSLERMLQLSTVYRPTEHFADKLRQVSTVTDALASISRRMAASYSAG